MKRQPSEWEEIMANGIADKGLISKIYNSSCRAIPEKQPNQQTGKRPKLTFVQRRHTEGQTYGKMFNIAHYGEKQKSKLQHHTS